MAEPVEDDISLLGTRETTEYISPSSDCQVPSTEYHTTGADYQVPEYLPAGALRAPVVPSQPRQERKHSSGRVLPGSGSDRVTPFSSSSPATSPRTPERSPNYNIDASGSTYALQENSIKLREKNLQLNQEIHTKHQECCSLKEKFSSLSTENMNLTRQLAKTSQENRRLVKQVNHLNDENKRLREKLSLITTQVKALPGGAGLAVSAADVPVPLKTKIVPLSEELDSFDDPPSRFISSYKDTLDEFEQISSNELAGTDSTWSVSDIEDEQLVVSLQLATRRMKDLLSSLQEQHHSLLLLSPLLNSLPPCSSQIVCSQCDTNFEHSHRTLSKDGTLSQRDRDLSTVTITPSTQFEEGTKYEVVDDDGACQSRLATCGSVLNTNFTSAGMNTSPLMDDINGESNIHMDANNSAEDRPHSPFDWRQVQMSDDEGRENDLTRPYTRTVSTSPDPVLEDEEERICPMCNAVFPQVIPQESFESHVVSHFEIENGFEVIA
ncbi:hypothetical protein OTU49_000701 [Cherax quadricarinatus]|uniref:UBZ1-type domain-containing protein n=2 Tax=Cherax quadricarinatus TaxID=27406 RepID=A0AAW0XI95_CHEQU